MRKLASIQKIRLVKPIEGADSIETVQINNWSIVTRKGEYSAGDLCVYCEIDSFLPVKEEFEFLRKSSYKKLADGAEGFRLKTIKLRGQVSQGLALPLSVLEDPEEMKIGTSKQPWGDQLQLGPYDNALVIEEGTDVTELLGIIKYEPPVPASLQGIAKGPFPSWIPKTDEERVQNLTDKYADWKHEDFYVTEKLDGSSATFYLKDGEFGVCSRNLDLVETPDNTFWRVAREMDIEAKLRALNRGNIAIQGELIGEGIQGNPYRLKGQTVRLFNIYAIDESVYYGMPMFIATATHSLKLQTVPIVQLGMKLPDSIDELIRMADGKSNLNTETDREGLVIRSWEQQSNRISFKVISNTFLLAEK
jgi:RNA ligase (TIGR02306 family)